MQILETIDLNTLLRIGEAEYKACISLYMPVIQAGRETVQNDIRFRELTRIARRKLETYHVENRMIDDLVRPLEILADDKEFWAKRPMGLAVFVSPDEIYVFRMPEGCGEEDAIVDKRFYIRPLLGFIDSAQGLNVLSLNAEKMELLKCNSASCAVQDTPPPHLASLEEFLKFHEFEESIQHAAGKSMPYTPVRGGEGDAANEQAYLEDYFRHIKNWLAEKEIINEQQPLYIVGDERSAGIFTKNAGDLPCEIRLLLQKNTNALGEEELLKAVGEELKKNAHEKAQARWEKLKMIEDSDPGKALQKPESILDAAHDKRIEVLFLPPLATKLWGVYDKDSHQTFLETRPDEAVGEELYNLAAIRTLQNGGQVIVNDNTGETKSAAICYW